MVFHTCWIDTLGNQQPEKRFWDVEPEPDSFPLPRKVFEVYLIYNTTISV